MLCQLPSDSVAQTVPGAGSIGGFFGFGGGGRATEKMQHVQQAQLVLEVAEAIKHTEALLLQLKTSTGSSVPSVISDVQAIMAELARMNGSFETIFEDPSGHGTHPGTAEFRQMQIERQMARLDEMKQTIATIEYKVASNSAAADELAALNTAAEGVVETQQIGNDAALLSVDLQRQQIVPLTEIWRSLAQQEAQKLEDEMIRDARSCNFWGPDFYQSETCK